VLDAVRHGNGSGMRVDGHQPRPSRARGHWHSSPQGLPVHDPILVTIDRSATSGAATCLNIVMAQLRHHRGQVRDAPGNKTPSNRR